MLAENMKELVSHMKSQNRGEEENNRVFFCHNFRGSSFMGDFYLRISLNEEKNSYYPLSGLR